jgi:hypothetical protein
VRFFRLVRRVSSLYMIKIRRTVGDMNAVCNNYTSVFTGVQCIEFLISVIVTHGKVGRGVSLICK